MTPDWITTSATVFTAIVIAASAVAALIQIRHLRKSNEIEIIAKWTEAIESAEFERARSFVLNDLPRILSDPVQVRALDWRGALPPELTPMRAVCNHFESVGVFIKLGNVEGRVACELWAFVVLECWKAIAPVAALVRKRTGKDAIWENFEYLAVLSERHIKTHPDGTYPADAARMPVDYSLINALQTATEVTEDGGHR